MIDLVVLVMAWPVLAIPALYIRQLTRPVGAATLILSLVLMLQVATMPEVVIYSTTGPYWILMSLLLALQGRLM